MPRTSRIDFPGALHHIIARGINRQPVFYDYRDQDLFLDRLGTILVKTATRCFAWALMPNHFHLLLSTASVHISKVMHRLLTGYAINFNRRHDRCGHLFQNRFKSILCQEDAYLLELVRYIHLNPLRGGVVKDFSELRSCRSCGHGVILGERSSAWQTDGYVLRLFHREAHSARRLYESFVRKGASSGKNSRLVEGNLVCRSGQWSEVKLEDDKIPDRIGYERILGDIDFINRVLGRTNEAPGSNSHLNEKAYDLEFVGKQVAEWLGLSTNNVLSSGRGYETVRARSLLCYLIVYELGVTQTRLSQDLGMTQPGVLAAARRGRELALREGYSLLNPS